MRIYLAAPFSKFREAITVKNTLNALGHRVQASWLAAAAESLGVDTTDPLIARKALAANTADLRASEVFCALAWPGLGQQLWCEAQEALHMVRPLHFVRMVPGSKLPLLAHAWGHIHDSLGEFVAAIAGAK
jgi:hypothetical protein